MKKRNEASAERHTFVRAASKEGSFIYEVGQVSSRESRGAGGNAVHSHILSQGQPLLLNVALQNLLPAYTRRHMAHSGMGTACYREHTPSSATAHP